MEALRLRNSFLDNTLTHCLDSAPYLKPTGGLSILPFAPSQMGEPPKTEVDLDQTIKEGLPQFLDSQDVRMEFGKDKNTGQVVVRIIQQLTGRVIREGPIILKGKTVTT
jgi:hypothetical protein